MIKIPGAIKTTWLIEANKVVLRCISEIRSAGAMHGNLAAENIRALGIQPISSGFT